MTATPATTPSTAAPSRRRPLEGPRGHWLLGCLSRMQKDPLGLYAQAWREHGDYVRIRILPGGYAYLLIHPYAVEQVLQKNAKNYRKPDVLLKPMRQLVGQGLFTSEGDFWLRQRRLAQPAFNRQHLAQLSPLMVQAAEAFVREREAAPAGRPVDLLEEMMRVSLRIAGTTFFSTDLADEAAVLAPAFRVAFAYLSRRMNSVALLPPWFPSAENRAFAQAKRLIDRVVLEVIAARRKSTNRPDDVLSLLLAAQDEATGAGMTDEQLKDEVVTLLTAGHETVGAALSWTWYLLGQHPQVQKDLHDEVHGHLQGRAPTIDDLPQLPLAKAVFEESMRLYPPAWGVPRQAIQTDEIDGFPIPAKGIIVLCQYLTHRHPDFWSEPEAFRPQRFLSAPPGDRPRFAYFPFGGGPRVCIGAGFALTEGPLVLATICQHFRVELAPGQTVTPDPTFTLRPRFGLKASLWPW